MICCLIFILPLGQKRRGEIQRAPSPSHPFFVFFFFFFFFFCSEDRRLGVMRLAMAFVLGLGGALAWRDSTLAKSRVGIFFFFSLYPEMYREQQGQPQK